jgi:hypothetical protein
VTATQRLACPAAGAVVVAVTVVDGSVGVDQSGPVGVGVAVGEVAEAVGAALVELGVALVGGCVGEAV